MAKASTTMMTVVPIATAPNAVLPSKLPTHKPLISNIDACNKLANRIGKANQPSWRAMEPSVKFFKPGHAAAMQGQHLPGKLWHGPINGYSWRHLLNRQRIYRRRCNTHLAQPVDQLLGRTHVDDTPQTNPAMGSSTHRTVLAGGINRRHGALCR